MTISGKNNTNVNVFYRDTGHVIEKLKIQRRIVFGVSRGMAQIKRQKEKEKKSGVVVSIAVL
jgi:hypothetical protein